MSACIFCQILAGELPASFVHQDEHFVVFLDIHPWRPGHALVVPRHHAQHVAELPAGTPGALFELGTRVATAMRASELPCADVNFVMADGVAANQTVPHVHLHVVPRAGGDGVRMAGRIFRHVLVPVGGAADRATLDAQAAAIAAHLDG